MRYHLTSVRLAIIKKSRNNKCCWEWGEKWGCKFVQLLQIKQYGGTSKINDKTTVWSRNPISGCILEGKENTILKGYLQFYVHCSDNNNSQEMETT